MLLCAGGGGEEGDPQGASVGSVWPPRSHSSPSDGSNALFERYWGIVTAKLRTQLSLAVTSSSFLRDCLVEGFPKLRGLLISSCNRLQVPYQSFTIIVLSTHFCPLMVCPSLIVSAVTDCVSAILNACHCCAEEH